MSNKTYFFPSTPLDKLHEGRSHTQIGVGSAFMEETLREADRQIAESVVKRNLFYEEVLRSHGFQFVEDTHFPVDPQRVSRNCRIVTLGESHPAYGAAVDRGIVEELWVFDRPVAVARWSTDEHYPGSRHYVLETVGLTEPYTSITGKTFQPLYDDASAFERKEDVDAG